MTKLTEITYWENIQGPPKIELEENNIIKKWIEKHVAIKKLKNCLEIGCYPGRYLSIFGKHGVQLNGIDYLPTTPGLAELYKSKGYKVGSFHCLDFHKETIAESFDCVYSLGFIEHFTDWEKIFEKHLNLTKENGIVIIETPNFHGWLQRIPRIIFDHENYKRHNIESMNLDRWVEILTNNNFEIITAEYIGGYMLWFEKDCGRIERLVRRYTTLALQGLKSIIYPKTENHYSYSGAIGVIARKRLR